jgi:ferric-dicitrate binding protein FerR (iron transport regulator)
MSSDRTDNLDRLIDAYLDGEASPAELEQLDKAICAAPENVRRFTRRAMLHSCLDQQLAACDDALADDAERPSPRTSKLRASVRNVAEFFAKPTPLSLAVAAVTLGVLLIAMAFMAPPVYRAITRTDSAKDAPSPEIVAQITGLHEAAWSSRQIGGYRGAHLAAGHRLELKAGLVEVTYRSGTRVTLQGPVVFNVAGPNAAMLHQGRLAAMVTLESRGFVVDTPAVRIVDLGTEFGVTTDPQRGAEVHVFQGEVAVEPQQHQRSRQVLRAGQAIVVNAAGERLSSKPADRQQFVRQLPSLERDYAPPTAYAELVLSHQPVLYYRMEPSHTDVLFDSGRWAKHGVLRRSAVVESPFVEGVDGKSLLLRGRTGGDYGIVARHPATTSNQLSVTAWIYLDEHSVWGMIAANWGDRRTGQFHFGQYFNDSDLAIGVTQNSGAPIYVREGRGQPLPLKTWQHVAFVIDGERARLYRNGQQVAEAPCRGILAESPVPALGIGCKTNDAGTAGSLGTLWHGRIDELALFHQALSPDAIKKLSQMPSHGQARPDKP